MGMKWKLQKKGLIDWHAAGRASKHREEMMTDLNIEDNDWVLRWTMRMTD